MASESAQVVEPTNTPLGKRKPKRSSKIKKKRMKPAPTYQGTKPRAHESKKTRRLLRKRAREYNSDDSEEEEVDVEETGKKGGAFDVEEEYEGKGGSSEDGEDGAVQHGVTKFTEGCRAFKLAFLKIMKTKSSEMDPLGPVLSAHKKLVAEKLAEEADDQKEKGEARKERRSAGEKGHVLAPKYDSKEKILLSISTKGVVKLFNAVKKAQSSQNNLDSSKAKDAKDLEKRRKRSFLSELRKPTIQNKTEDGKPEEPRWAPLRDDYMLTNSKLKNWDKMQDPASTSASKKAPLESSSDDD